MLSLCELGHALINWRSTQDPLAPLTLEQVQAVQGEMPKDAARKLVALMIPDVSADALRRRHPLRAKIDQSRSAPTEAVSDVEPAAEPPVQELVIAKASPNRSRARTKWALRKLRKVQRTINKAIETLEAAGVEERNATRRKMRRVAGRKVTAGPPSEPRGRQQPRPKKLR